MMPTEQAALSTLNSGRTVPIMMSNPLPSFPSMADSGTRASLAETGEESLPRSPSPSKEPCTRIPGGASNVALAVRFENGGAAEMHAHHHRRGTAVLRDPPHDGCCAPGPEAEPSDLRRADGAHEAGGGQRVQSSLGKCSLLVDVGSFRGNGFATNPFQLCGVLRRHASPRGGHRGEASRARAYGGEFSRGSKPSSRGSDQKHGLVFMPTI